MHKNQRDKLFELTTFSPKNKKYVCWSKDNHYSLWHKASYLVNLRVLLPSDAVDTGITG